MVGLVLIRKGEYFRLEDFCFDVGFKIIDVFKIFCEYFLIDVLILLGN